MEDFFVYLGLLILPIIIIPQLLVHFLLLLINKIKNGFLNIVIRSHNIFFQIIT